MSTFRNPVGPQPSKVYWRRRLVALLVLIAVVVIVILLLSRLFGGAPDEPVDDTAAAAPTSSDAAVAPSPSSTPTLIEGADCLPENVTVTAITDSESYGSDEEPGLAFTIANTGTAACTYNVGPTQQTFTVTSGEEQYWSSKDCETDPIDADLMLEPNVPVTSEPITWDKTRSSEDTCGEERPAAPGGGATYYLNVSVGAVESEPVAFILQ
ncbi:hypothetical protein [Marisediminicola senii]|uniref:hypothetical protein n=1 Tax=Marisediminicola senii TaxID=2711233 RepID=UPI0013EA9C48|nr:hypothetical protein [Marisediminicola senii]